MTIVLVLVFSASAATGTVPWYLGQPKLGFTRLLCLLDDAQGASFHAA
jgi:hypothetical protein